MRRVGRVKGTGALARSPSPGGYRVAALRVQSGMRVSTRRDVTSHPRFSLGKPLALLSRHFSLDPPLLPSSYVPFYAFEHSSALPRARRTPSTWYPPRRSLSSPFPPIHSISLSSPFVVRAISPSRVILSSRFAPVLSVYAVSSWPLVFVSFPSSSIRLSEAFLLVHPIADGAS